MNTSFRNLIVFVWLVLTVSLSLFLLSFSSIQIGGTAYCPRDSISLDSYIVIKIVLLAIGMGWSLVSGGVCKILDILLRSRKNNLDFKLFAISLLMTSIAICIGSIHSFSGEMSAIEYCEQQR
jgi:hypothetical protein